MTQRTGPGPSGGGSVALLLCAGASARFDGRPKALLPIGRETAIARIARIALANGCARALAVVGAHREEIRRALPTDGPDLLDHPDWRLGRTGSLQRGLRAVPDASEVLVWPVDHPFVDERTVAALHAAARDPGLACWWIPTHRGIGGHPVLIGRAAVARVLDLAPSAPLRSVLPGLGPQVRRVPVGDPGILENVDTPDAYWAARSAWAQRNGRSDGT